VRIQIKKFHYIQGLTQNFALGIYVCTREWTYFLIEKKIGNTVNLMSFKTVNILREKNKSEGVDQHSDGEAEKWILGCEKFHYFRKVFFAGLLKVGKKRQLCFCYNNILL
jgi:hypothetical protein